MRVYAGICSSWGIGEDTRVSSAAAAMRTVEALLREREAGGSFSGVVGVKQGDQELLLDAFGYASRAWSVPTTVETRFDTASITKLFTAVATLQLVEKGAFALDTSVIRYLGLEKTGISPAVTPYHLLTHTSGIADDADEEAGERYEDVFLERPNYSVIETVDYLPQFVGKPPNFGPGEGCRYCNVSYVLLGLMIERATGSTYRSCVAEQVFAPAGMNRSGFFRMDVANRMSPRVSRRSRARTVASPGGAATSTPTRRSVDPTAAPMSPSATYCASTGQSSAVAFSVPL